jgi:GWxTD domain-containing protein
MKRYLIFLYFLLNSIFTYAFELDATLDYIQFRTSSGTTYLETYLLIHGQTYTLRKNGNGTFSGNIEVTMIFSKDNKIANFDKYTLTTGELTSIDSSKLNILDLRRIALDPGKYRMEFILNDVYALDTNRIVYIDSVQVIANTDKVMLSGIELVDKHTPTKEKNIFSKSGHDIYPRMSSFYTDKDRLFFYSEIYNTDKFFGKDQKYLVMYSVEYYENGLRINELSSLQRLTSSPLQVIMAGFDISELQPGNYNIRFEVRDQLNQVVAEEVRFFRKSGRLKEIDITDLSNVDTDFMTFINNPDTLVEYIRCLRPIATRTEAQYANNVLKAGDKEIMKRFIVSFWSRRNPVNPKAEWDKYHSQVVICDGLFRTQFMRSYDTDRGRVFLQYGPPDVRAERPNEPFAYPYEIWQYYTLRNAGKGQTNRMFVFWNKDFASNNYELLHSNVLGERRVEAWQRWLMNRGKGTSDIDSTRPDPTFGSMSNDLFLNPR